MPKLALNNFLGLFTRSGRSGRPAGALDDILNYVLNSKFGKAILRTGYTADISGAITSVDSVTMTTVQNNYKTAAEIPESKYLDVLLGTDAGANKWFFQKPYYHQSATATNSWLKWGESLSSTVSSVSAANSTFVVDSGVATNDYYNGWVLYHSTFAHYLIITDYVGSTKTATLSIAGNAANTVLANGVTVTLARHFHDNVSFAPSFTTQPCVLQQQNGILASGGQGSTVGYKPMFSGYVNRTYFTDVTNASFTYQATYVGEAELKAPSAGNPVGPQAATGPAGDLPSGTWYGMWVLETEDGQRSTPFKHATNNVASAGATDWRQEVRVSQNLDKRYRYLVFFLGNDASDWNRFYYIAKYDLAAATTSFTASTPAYGVTKFYYTRTFTFGNSNWTARGMSLAEYLGTDTYTSSTVSFSFATLIANRLVVAKYYDYSSAVNYNDQIRFSGFGDGVPQYNVLPDISDFTESTIGAGDPAVITGLSKNENYLFIAKTNSVYAIEMTDDPATWILTTIAPNIGCDAPYTLITTPMGVFWAKGGDDIYFWKGGFPIGLAKNWLVDFRALSTSSLNSWYAWYDKSLKSIGIKCDTSDETVWYQAHLDYPIEDVFAWVRHKQQHSIKHVSVRTDGVPFFTNATATYYYDRAATDDAGTAITPFIDTGDYVPDEDALVRVRRWYLNCEQSGATANQLDAQLLVDGTAVGSYTALTKTNTRFNLPAPIAAMGSRMRLKFNTNGTRASLGTSHTIHEIGIEYDAVPYQGDAAVRS